MYDKSFSSLATSAAAAPLTRVNLIRARANRAKRDEGGGRSIDRRRRVVRDLAAGVFARLVFGQPHENVASKLFVGLLDRNSFDSHTRRRRRRRRPHSPLDRGSSALMPTLLVVAVAAAVAAVAAAATANGAFARIRRTPRANLLASD